MLKNLKDKNKVRSPKEDNNIIYKILFCFWKSKAELHILLLCVKKTFHAIYYNSLKYQYF